MIRNIIFNKYSRFLINKQLNRADSSSSQTGNGINLNVYHQKSEETLEYLCEKFDSILEDEFDKGADVCLNNGVLTIVVNPEHTYVINKQTPNRQIWLSSPISGPARFDFIEGQWKDKHNQMELRYLLASEVSKLLKRKVDC